MTETLIRGRHVVRGVSDAGAAEILDDAAVLVRDGRIAAVGPADEIASAADHAEVLGGDDHVIFPGFVNAHHHVGLTPLQLGTPDLPLEVWLAHRTGARKVDLYLDTLYSAFEMIRSGVTTVQHLHNRVPGGVDDVLRGAGEVLRAYRDVGMRVSYSYGIRDQNRIVYEPDEDFIARLPEPLAAEVREYASALSLPVDDCIAVFETLAREHAEDPRIAIQLAPLNFQWCSDAALERAAEVSAATGAPLHMHLLETAYQRAYARRRTGGSALARLEELGLLGERMTLGHGVWMTERDLDLVASTGTRICHNCSSNMRIRSGTAPVVAMLERGIPVAIGIDEAGVNDDRDMLQELRMVLRAHRAPGIERRVPTPAEVFRMGTENGAGTTGFGSRIGRIDPGRAADLVLARWSHLAHPWLDPEVPVLDALVQRARAGAVETVLVEGEAVLRDGRIACVDEAAALEELARALSAPLDADERRRREMSRQLLAHVESFYEGYLEGERFEPWDHRHSRS